MNWIVCWCLFLLLVVKEFLHYKERKDLYNRIMSRDLTEYSTLKRGTGKGGNFIKEKLDKS